MHVRERAARVRLPGPYVQLVERVQAVPIGSTSEVEQLAFQRSGTLEGDVLDRNQRHFAVGGRLVHDRLRALDVDGLVLQVFRIDVVDAHRTAIDAARAGDRRVTLGDRGRYILEAVVRGAHLVHE